MSESVEGLVIETDNNIAKVKLTRHSECENCGSCSGQNEVIQRAHNKIGAKPGQRVFIEVENNNVLKAAFIVFILPLLSIAAGIIIAELVSGILQISSVVPDIIGACVCTLISVTIIKHFDKHIHLTQRLPGVVGIIGKKT